MNKTGHCAGITRKKQNRRNTQKKEILRWNRMEYLADQNDIGRFFCSAVNHPAVMYLSPKLSHCCRWLSVCVCAWSHTVQSLCSPSDTLEKTKADNRSSENLLILHSSEQGRTICPSLCECWSKNKRERERHTQGEGERQIQCMMDLVLSGRSGTSMMSAVFSVSARRRFSGFTVRKSHRERERGEEEEACRETMSQPAALAPSLHNWAVKATTSKVLHFCISRQNLI